mgnify:CR=1 FL=1
MITTICNVHVTDDGIDAFRAASLANAEASRNEPGITRFELMQQVDDPTRFIIYEEYVDQADTREERSHELPVAESPGPRTQRPTSALTARSPGSCSWPPRMSGTTPVFASARSSAIHWWVIAMTASQRSCSRSRAASRTTVSLGWKRKARSK